MSSQDHPLSGQVQFGGERTPARETILGLRFFNGNAEAAVSRMMMRGGLVVVPSAPALLELTTNREYREAALNADMVIADSAFMVLVWNLLNGGGLKKLSGLAYLRELLTRDEVRRPGNTFWIMASECSMERNRAWLMEQGFCVEDDDIYIAPMYGADTSDPELLKILERRKPEHIVVTIGGGKQEGLGHYIARRLSYKPAIHCIGAAIAFLSGDQVNIPEWADRWCLGWLFRCASAPQTYGPRYWNARKLLGLMLRHGSECPPAKFRESSAKLRPFVVRSAMSRKGCQGAETDENAARY